MSLDLLINLIIIFVIVISVLKRLQNVAQKGREIKSPPPAAPSPTPKMAEKKSTVLQEQKIPTEPPEFLKPVVEQAKRMFFPEDFWEHKTTEIPEPALEEPLLPEVEEIQKISLRDITLPEKEPIPGMKLNFGSSDVVGGIVMREILGPPVSMRQGDIPGLMV